MEIVTDVTVPPRLLKIPHAAAYSGESRATLYKEKKDGNIKFVKMGNCTLVEFDELNRYIDAKIQAGA